MDQSRLKNIKAICSDVDGVLTDGRLYYFGDGRESKVFSVRDGLGIKLAQRAGLKVAFLTGRHSKVVRDRADELAIDALKIGRNDKQAAFQEICEELRLERDQIAYIGDDIIDLAPIAMSGVSFCPADAVTEVRALVDHVIPIDGGAGVVRYVVELILKAKGQWADRVAQYEVKDA